MTTTATPPISEPERVLLHGVRWSTYEALLEDAGGRRLKMTYDRGDLEIVSPSKKHEWYGRLLGRLVETISLALRIPIQSVASTTWRSALKERGLEADESYYVQNELVVRGRAEFDPDRDPFPDLAIEIEITRSVLDRLAIYAALGVREIWRYDGRLLTAHVLRDDGSYHAVERSEALPFLVVADLGRFLERAREVDETTVASEVYDWARATFGG